jgi:NADH dehydrogenase FAD-containing subunit
MMSGGWHRRPRPAVDVLLDRGGYHLFTPLLYQVATALLNPSEITYPLRALFRKSPNVRVWATTVTGVDLKRRVVHASRGEEIPYDYLGVVSARTVVWAGGVAPVVPSTQPEPETGHSRRVRVDEFLRIPGAQRAYALGDAAGVGQDGKELPMVSAPAIQAGRYVARAIRADLSGDRAAPFRYFDKGKMATIGRNAAVAQLRSGLELTGFAGWLAWLLVHVWYLAGVRNRLMALASMAWYYLCLDRPIRIILQTPPDPIVATLRSPDPDKRRAAPAEIGGRTL